jgi:hypothetical protein
MEVGEGRKRRQREREREEMGGNPRFRDPE